MCRQLKALFALLALCTLSEIVHCVSIQNAHVEELPVSESHKKSAHYHAVQLAQAHADARQAQFEKREAVKLIQVQQEETETETTEIGESDEHVIAAPLSSVEPYVPPQPTLVTTQDASGVVTVQPSMTVPAATGSVVPVIPVATAPAVIPVGNESSNESDANQASSVSQTQPSIIPVQGETASQLPLKLFSDEVKIEEHLGLTHWMFYSDGGKIYSKNYVKDTKTVEVLGDLKQVKSIAIDSNKGYLFIAEQVEDDESTVSRFLFKVNATDHTFPTVSVNGTTRLEVMTGKNITDITIDEDQSILYVVDSGLKRLTQLKYADEMLRMMNTQIGLSEVLYEDDYNLENVNSVAIDHRGDIFWSASKYGKELGVIHRGSSDDPMDSSVEKESKVFDNVNHLFYGNEFLFFTGPGNSTNTTSRAAIYYKNVPKTGEISSVVHRVIDGFEDIISVTAIDEFIYFADSNLGIFTVEAYQDGTFSEARPITLHTGDALKPVAPMPTTMVIFALGGMQGIFFSLSVLMALLALNLF